MKEIRDDGLRSARHLQGNLYEVRVTSSRAAYRILFAPQGRRSQVLLALVAMKKKSQKTPLSTIHLAQRRLRDWQERAA